MLVWECKLVEPLWKTVEMFALKLHIDLLMAPTTCHKKKKKNMMQKYSGRLYTCESKSRYDAKSHSYMDNKCSIPEWMLFGDKKEQTTDALATWVNFRNVMLSGRDRHRRFKGRWNYSGGGD